MLTDTTLRDATGPAAEDDKGLAVVDPAHYVITREIARGGMGRVLGARDRRLGREVAIKEVLANEGALARRFEREARITARLQHPSIVSVHEAGSWPTGEPFFVMPLVSGRSLDERIAAAKEFDERLALVPNVLAIADAMAYAHGQRVIHRDLKPKNIVVGEFGETIVLDWGVAKQLDARDEDSAGGSSNPKIDQTAAGDLLGTPTYMPPEQAAGPAVDERADVYAIGAILYHVLAGRPPYLGETVGDVIMMLTSRPPPPVVTFAPDAPPELIAIVEHAMARDPAARYPTARELADDLRRFQTGQLVGAHRYSLRQLLSRWARRHVTVLAAAAAAIAVGLGVGVVALTKVFDAEQAAEDQRTFAVASRRDAEDLLEYMLVDLRSKLQSVGRLDLLEAVARKASAYYDSHGMTSDEDAHLAAEARLGIGSVLEYRGDLPGARAETLKAKAMFDVLAIKRADVLGFRLGVIEAEMDLARFDVAQGDLGHGLLGFRDALARTEQLRVDHPADNRVLHASSVAHGRIAAILEQRGEPEAALAEYRLQLATYNKPPGSDPVVDKDLLNAHASIGHVLYNTKHDLAGALAEERIALAIGLDRAAKDPRDTKWLADIALSHREVAELLAEQHDETAALAEYRASIEIEQRLVMLDPANTDWQTGLAVSRERVGTLLWKRDDPTAALAEFRATAAVYSELVARDPTNTDWQRSSSVALNKLGEALTETSDFTGAETAFRSALAIREKLVAKDPSHVRWQRDLFYSHVELAALYAKQKAQARSVAETRIALAIAEQIAAAHPKNEAAQNDVAAAQESIGDSLVELHDIKGARAAYNSSLEIANRYATQPGADPAWHDLVEHVTTKLSHLSTSSS